MIGAKPLTRIASQSDLSPEGRGADSTRYTIRSQLSQRGSYITSRARMYFQTPYFW